jgi:IS605 OrfB family transposase
VQRSVKVSLALATAAKRCRLSALLREVRSCTQRYIDHLWSEPGRLDAATLNSVVGGSLSYRHRSNCLKVALETISATRRAAKVTGIDPSRPRINGAVRLSSLVAKVEPGKGVFNYVLKISGLVSGKPIVIPFKRHKRLNYWLANPNAELLQGCTLGDNWAVLWIEVADQRPREGDILGVDIGINKLLVDSDGNRYGTEIKAVCARVRRCRPDGKGRLRASRARKDYINREVKKLPWDSLGTLGIEDLKNLKLGKKPGRGKKFRKAIAPWTYRQAIARIEMLAQENRVRLVAVDPRNTSRTCPICKTVAKESRRAECFCCVNCGFSADADHVGAVNVLVRAHPNSGQSMVARCFAKKS